MCAVTLGLVSGCQGLIRYGEAVDYPPYRWREKVDVVMPANAPYISQQFTGHFEARHGGHLGIDVWEAIGTPVLAAASGVVERSFFEPMFGHQIVIRHGEDEKGRPVRTHYKHLDARLVEAGARVARGQQIATLGDTGLLGALPHLHFEVIVTIPHEGNIAHDPHLFWADGVGRVTCFDPARRYDEGRFITTYPVRCL
jgi:murein DD-endopeptidase MepM/ murein hydrolase activator NlpD